MWARPGAYHAGVSPSRTPALPDPRCFPSMTALSCLAFAMVTTSPPRLQADHCGGGRRMRSLEEFAAQKLGQLDRASLRRAAIETTRLDGLWVERNGRRLLSFCCNDYLNLTHHPAIKEAAIAAIARYGIGAGAARLVTGNHSLLAALVVRMARLT